MGGGYGGKFASYLPEVYAGHPMRIQRYDQYDQMDMDSEVNAALDTIADFSTRIDKSTESMFQITYKKEASDSEKEVLKNCLQQWSKVNKFKKRVWRMFRSTLKYGDQFFIRDPETLNWIGVDAKNVEKVIVNEAEGKEPEAYLFRDLDLNLQTLTASAPTQYGSNLAGGAGTNSLQNNISSYGRGAGNVSGGSGVNNRASRFSDNNQNITAVDATHVIHLSLSEGLDENWPFGTSILESVFMVFRQKQLLEDAIIIYRIQRAPERRVFYVDVGNMPAHKAGAYLERVKNEIHQRRFPSRNGGGASVVDAAYNPMSMMEDFFFAQTSEGRGSRVETLPGGENLGQIDDLRYWDNRLKRGLRVPSSYLPSGPDDGQQVFTDGRVGTAYIQEFRFAQYCQRLQNLIVEKFDEEFKLFVRRRGFPIDSSIYELTFNEPENFSTFAKIELETAQIGVYAPLAEMKHFSKRWLMMEKLGMTEQEIMDNEMMWIAENRQNLGNVDTEGTVGSAPSAGLDSMGIRPTDDDLDAGDDFGDEPEIQGDDGAASPISGDEGAEPADDNPL
jgi:hypothetical protein